VLLKFTTCLKRIRKDSIFFLIIILELLLFSIILHPRGTWHGTTMWNLMGSWAAGCDQITHDDNKGGRTSMGGGWGGGGVRKQPIRRRQEAVEWAELFRCWPTGFEDGGRSWPLLSDDSLAKFRIVMAIHLIKLSRQRQMMDGTRIGISHGLCGWTLAEKHGVGKSIFLSLWILVYSFISPRVRPVICNTLPDLFSISIWQCPLPPLTPPLPVLSLYHKMYLNLSLSHSLCISLYFSLSHARSLFSDPLVM